MEEHDSSRYAYRHDDNIESVESFEDHAKGEVECVDNFGNAVDEELSEAAMEIVPLTPKTDEGLGTQLELASKENSNGAMMSLRLWGNRMSSHDGQQGIRPATEPFKRSNPLKSIVSPQDWNLQQQKVMLHKCFSADNKQRRTPLKPMEGNSSGSPRSYLPSNLYVSPESTTLHYESPSTASPKLLTWNGGPSPGEDSLSTEYTSSSPSKSDSSTVTSFRRIANMPHRSSTSLSLLHGEVISLEPGRRTSSYPCDSDSGSLAQIRQFHEEMDEISQFEAIDLEGGMPIEGMEIGGGMRSSKTTELGFPLSPSHQHEKQSIMWETFSKIFRLVQDETIQFGSRTCTEVRKLSVQAVETTQRVLLGYRFHPVSPTRSRELDDLSYLQRCHKEKLGYLAEKDSGDHFDFVLVLTPQEAYRYWSDLLDLRLEHLGVDDLSVMNTPLETASTHSTESCESDNHFDASSGDQVTPLTGIYRRRGKRSVTPPSARTMIYESRQSIATSVLSSNTKRSVARLSMFEKAVGYNSPTFKKLEENSVLGDTSPSPMMDHRRSVSSVRRRWGNRTGGKPGVSNMLSPPVRSLTRGAGSMRKLKMNSTSASKGLVSETENCDGSRRACIPNEEFPNPVIPRGIAARTNGLLQFLSALKRGIVIRRHRPNNNPIYCKIFSNNGGDTIQYQMVEPEEAMVAFKEQRVRYNRNLNSASSPGTVLSFSREWSFGASADGSPVHKFKLPDFIAAKRYREKLMKKHGVTKKFMDFASKAANSGIARAADIVAVHPASHLDPRLPGSRKGELGTSSLRRSMSDYHTPFTFSLVTIVGQPFKSGKSHNVDANENKWYSGEGSELQFKILDFEMATEGEYWLVFRGFLLLHRDAAVGRFAAERRAGIGGGNRRDRDDGEGEEDEKENRLHQNEFGEPVTAGLLERLYVKMRKLDDSYMKGYVLPSAVPPPSDYFLGFSSPGTQIWSRLRMAGLETQRLYSVDTRRVMLKVRCPEDRLTDVAEVLRLKMKTIDGGYSAFLEDTADHFLPRCDPLECPPMYQGTMASLLHSKDRQTIIDFIIGSRIRDSGAELGQTTDVGKLIQARIPLHMHQKLNALFKLWVFWWKRENWIGRDGRSLSSLTEYPSSPFDKRQNDEDSSKIKHKKTPNCLKRFFVGAFYQPLDDIEEYFGEQVTFYFAWMQHCASHLLFLAVFGLIVTVCQLSTNNLDHPIRPYFAVVIMIWTFLVLVNWRKRSNFLAYRWGAMDHKVQETTRPEFFGEYVVDEITKEWVVKYPKWKRWLKYLISFPVSVAFTGFALLLILLVHTNRDLQMASYVQSQINPDNAEPFEIELSLKVIGRRAPIVEVPITRDLLLDPQFWKVMGTLPAMLGLCIPIMNLILMKISVLLNNFENYRTESEYRSHLIIKVFSFRFVSQFGTLYYYAAISMGDRQAIENGLLRMGTSLLIYTTVAHWWTIFLQVYFFMLVRQVRRWFYRRKLAHELRQIELEEEAITYSTSASKENIEKRQIRLMNKRTLLDQAQDDVWFEIMNNAHDSFPEYITSVVQFSFVACFSAVLPITPLLCLFNYLLSMRYDAYKLCRGRRRPLAQKTGGIGVWEHLLHIVAVIAVLTNCWLMVFTSSSFSWLIDEVGGLGIFAIVVAWEHVMLLIKYVMHTTISPLPRSVRDDLKSREYRMERQRHRSMRSKKDRRSNLQDPESQSQLSTVTSVGPVPVYATPEVLRTIPSAEEDSSNLFSI